MGKRETTDNMDLNYEHKKLTEILNDLFELNRYKKGRQEFARILSKMTDFGLIYFKKEDEYLTNFSLEFKEVKNSQRNYILTVATYNVDLLSTNPPNPKEVIEFLEKWWSKHLLCREKEL
ncbi:hypothetical protein [Lutibacter sp.]|uniref:hypothetical protein n=1 Tax=Lutibacter sp. TaxID=1925666 RepID=UPI00356AA96D